MDLEPGREGEVEAMVVVADGVEVMNAATGEREGTEEEATPDNSRDSSSLIFRQYMVDTQVASTD